MLINDLPVELLRMITDYLPRIGDVYALGSTCQGCYSKLNWVLYRRDAETGSSAILWAARYGQLGTIRLSLNSGGSIGITTGILRATPLHIAASFGHTDLAEFLVKQGADITAECSNGLTPLHFAIIKHHPYTMKRLLAAGANPNARTGALQFTPLHIASFAGHAGIVLELLRHGAKVDARDRNDEMALHWSVRGTIRLGFRRTVRLKGWYEQRIIEVMGDQLRRQRHCDCASALAVVRALMEWNAARHMGKEELAKLLGCVSSTYCINGQGARRVRAHNTNSWSEIRMQLGAQPALVAAYLGSPPDPLRALDNDFPPELGAQPTLAAQPAPGAQPVLGSQAATGAGPTSESNFCISM